jgi:hypothetical protein
MGSFWIWQLSLSDQEIACRAEASSSPVAKKHKKCSVDTDCGFAMSGWNDGCHCPEPINKKFQVYYQKATPEFCGIEKKSHLVCTAMCGSGKVRCGEKGFCERYDWKFPTFL